MSKRRVSTATVPLNCLNFSEPILNYSSSRWRLFSHPQYYSAKNNGWHKYRTPDQQIAELISEIIINDPLTLYDKLKTRLLALYSEPEEARLRCLWREHVKTGWKTIARFRVDKVTYRAYVPELRSKICFSRTFTTTDKSPIGCCGKIQPLGASSIRWLACGRLEAHQ